MCHSDYERWKNHPELYRTLSERREEILESAKKKYMGHYYGNPPKPTKEELQEKLERNLKKLKRHKELRAPSVLIEANEEEVKEIYFQIQNKEYGSMSDPVYKKYRKSYYEKDNAWENSDELDKLLEEIEQYDELEWEKVENGI
jgi:HD-GYP domain-containing protein (c-di-GMP phosphodiesterase class II)